MQRGLVETHRLLARADAYETAMPQSGERTLSAEAGRSGLHRVQRPLRAPEVVRAPEPAELRRTADVLVEILAEAGVEIVFGLPGSSIAPIDDALMDRSDMRKIVTRHEAGAAFAATIPANEALYSGGAEWPE